MTSGHCARCHVRSVPVTSYRVRVSAKLVVQFFKGNPVFVHLDLMLETVQLLVLVLFLFLLVFPADPSTWVNLILGSMLKKKQHYEGFMPEYCDWLCGEEASHH